MPDAELPVVVMLPVSETVTVFVLLVVLIPLVLPVVVKAIPRLIVSGVPAIAVSPMLPFMVLSLLVMTKSAAMTGVAKARQTKADVPSRTLLRGFELVVFAWCIGRMASVLGTESLSLTPTTKYPLES